MKIQTRLLIAEDDPDDQYFFQEAIKVVCPRDVETHFVLDGAQLMKLLRENLQERQMPNLIVLDLNMRVKNGRTTLHEIKSDPVLADIPVVVLSTSLHAEDIEYCKHYGAAYYRKPDSITKLVEIVRTLYREYLN
ncbi:MAG TPA: response regulator [Anaerolineales bacterium]|nr:response regulator [Anaerolineales bacterium]